MRRLVFAACIAGSPAHAEAPMTWSELIAPDRLAQNIARSLILTVRSFVDVTYSSLDIDIRRGAFALHNIKAYPLIEATEYADCDIEIRRLEVVGAGFARPDDFELTLRADDISVLKTCLIPEDAEAIEAISLTSLHVPRAVIKASYHMPSSAARITGFAIADHVAELSFDLSFDYLWVDTSDPDYPYPVIYLDRADVSLRNLGVWAMLKDALPAELLDPQISPARLQIGTAQGLVELGAAEPFAVDLSGQVAAAWTSFLQEPESLHAALTPAEPTFIHIDELENQPGKVLESLVPQLAATAIPRVKLLPVALLETALSSPDRLSDEQRLQAGEHLLTGVGAPRSVEKALELLLPLAQEGNEVALKVIAGLKNEAVSAADYKAVAAAAVGQPDVVTILDDLERRLGFSVAVALQPALEERFSFDGIETVRDLRMRALDSLAGYNSPRSFAQATYWAQLAIAAGDIVSLDVIEDISGRAITEKDKEALAKMKRAAASQALQDWIRGDLPSVLALNTQ